MTVYAVTRHVYQHDGSRFASQNCTPSSGASGAAAVTVGRISKSGGQMRNLVSPSEEVNPNTPGWHLDDLDLALSRLGVGFVNRTGDGWDALEAAHAAERYLVVQGDSDQFSDNTCSGRFDGLHAIGVHPEEDYLGRWLIDDPICKVRRFEYSGVIRRYAEKLSPSIYFGMFTIKVPKAPQHVHSRYGGRRTSPFPDRTRADERVVRVHDKPSSSDASVVAHLDRDEVFTSWQVTDKGINGSGRWYGNHDGDRWVHASRLRRQGGST